MLTDKEVLEQSRSALKQWEEKWKQYAKENGEIYLKNGTSLKELAASGLGRTCLCVASGPTLEKKIHQLKELVNQDVDIICVDKAFSDLCQHGIIPRIVVAEDANINYGKFLEPYLEQSKQATLVMNVCSNPKWARHWKGKLYFHVNMDNIHTEKIFMPISGCQDIIPAASNVGNTVMVIAHAVCKYERYLLLGFDYCWGTMDNYYAFNDNIKRYWMNHMSIVDKIGRMVHTSSNLWFSVRWLNDYMRVIGEKAIIDVGGEGINGAIIGNLERQMKNSRPRNLTLQEQQEQLQNKLREMIVNPVDIMHAINNFSHTVNIHHYVMRYTER